MSILVSSLSLNVQCINERDLLEPAELTVPVRPGATGQSSHRGRPLRGAPVSGDLMKR